MSNKSAALSGISLPSLLGVVFVTLKLCGVINWPWIWVLCPFWIGPAILGLCLASLGLVAVLWWFFQKVTSK
jgi:hypothetical protein